MNVAEELISRFSLGVPIDLLTLIENFSDLSVEFGADIEKDGQTERKDDSYLIRIRSERDELTTRDRFTIAHELGHVLLGHIDEHEIMYRAEANELEYEANDFAGNLLMPREQFLNTVYQNVDDRGICDLEEVSNIFHVSVSAVRTRGRFLGVFSW